MLKMALFDCAINEKRLQWWRRRWHLPSFFVPAPGDSIAQESSPPGICHPRQKKCICPGISPGGGGRGVGGWAQVELTDAFIFGVCFSLRLLSYGDGDPSKPHLNLQGKHFLLLFCVICPCLLENCVPKIDLTRAIFSTLLRLFWDAFAMKVSSCFYS